MFSGSFFSRLFISKDYSEISTQTSGCSVDYSARSSSVAHINAVVIVTEGSNRRTIQLPYAFVCLIIF
jgi:hypothetical protein